LGHKNDVTPSHQRQVLMGVAIKNIPTAPSPKKNTRADSRKSCVSAFRKEAILLQTRIQGIGIKR